MRKQTSEKILHGNEGGDELHGGSNSHFLTLDSGVDGLGQCLLKYISEIMKRISR